MAQKGRKIGRNKKRPSQARYVGEHRSEKNKRLRQAKHAALITAKADNPPRVPRGTARAKRREHLQRAVA